MPDIFWEVWMPNFGSEKITFFRFFMIRSCSTAWYKIPLRFPLCTNICNGYSILEILEIALPKKNDWPYKKLVLDAVRVCRGWYWCVLTSFQCPIFFGKFGCQISVLKKSHFSDFSWSGALQLDIRWNSFEIWYKIHANRFLKFDIFDFSRFFFRNFFWTRIIFFGSWDFFWI